MDKVWISALDERTRQGKFNHLEMNQKRVPLDKPFNVSGEKLMFPGDPKGSAGNVVNCRCSVAQVVRRDADGNIMRVADKVPVRDINSSINTFRAARTLKEAEEYSKKIIKEGYGFDIGSVKVSRRLSLGQYNNYNKQLNSLLSEYNPNKIHLIERPNYKPTLMFQSDKTSYGNVIVGKDGKYVARINFGSSVDLKTSLSNAEYRKLYGKNKFHSYADKANVEFQTLTHEFAHTLSTSIQRDGYGKVKYINDFWNEMEVVRKKYYKELNLNKGNQSAIDQIYLGRYSNTNIDEFMADGFAEYKLSKKPTKYAKEIGQLIDKYFKK
jgi:hypothetical protein